MAASRVAERYLVLDHLDVGQPYPFLRLWERWGLGEGPPREETRRHHRAEPSWSPPRPSPPQARRHSRPRREDPPASTFTGAPEEHPPVWDDEVSVDDQEDARPPSDSDGEDLDEGTAEEETTEEVSAPAPPPPPLPRPAMYTVDEMRAMGANAPLVPTKRVVSEEEAEALAKRKAAAAAEVQRRLRELALREATPPAALEETPAKEPEHAVEPALVKEKEEEKEKKEEEKEKERLVIPEERLAIPHEVGVAPRRYAADELRALNVGCDAPPPGFDPDPAWASSLRPSPRAADAEPDEREGREEAAAEMAALREEMAATDTSGWSLWEDDEGAFAEDCAVALDALKEMDAVRAEQTRVADADAAARATPRVDAVIFPADALRAFSATDVETSGCMRPYADARSSLGVVFGTWSEMLARGGSGGGGWRARVGFVQPWEGEPEALVAWLCSEDAKARKSGMIGPVGWLKTTHLTGPALTAAVSSAYERAALRGDGVGDETAAGVPPPASAVYVSLDVVRTVTEERACLEVYDLRTGRELVFELSGEDDDDDDDDDDDE